MRIVCQQFFLKKSIFYGIFKAALWAGYLPEGEIKPESG